MDQQKVIFINPKFKAYINPNFLKPNSNQIHINPKFINQQANSSQDFRKETTQAANPAQIKQPVAPIASSNAIIKNTKRSLVRATTTAHPAEEAKIAQQQVPENVVTKKMNLIKISNTKLVNASELMKAQQKENEIIKKATESLIKSKKLAKKADSTERSIYKLDRRKSSPGVGKKKKKIISTYSIRRVDSSLTPKIIIGQKLLKS